MVKGRKTNAPRFRSILEAAAKVFREKGYHYATIADVAGAVGLQSGSLYYYIESKEDLLYEIIMYGLDVYLESIGDISNSNEGADILLRRALAAHLQPIDGQFDMIFVFTNERHNLYISEKYKNEVARRTRLYMGIWLDILKKGKKEGIFRPDLDSSITLWFIFGALNWTLRWYNPDGKYDRDQLSKIYAQNIIDGIKNR